MGVTELAAFIVLILHVRFASHFDLHVHDLFEIFYLMYA